MVFTSLQLICNKNVLVKAVKANKKYIRIALFFKKKKKSAPISLALIMLRDFNSRKSALTVSKIFVNNFCENKRHRTETYLAPYQTFMMKHFCGNS